MISFSSTTFARDMGMAYREKDMTPTVECRRVDYPAGTVFSEHRHTRHQLICGRAGLLVITSEAGRWVIPPTRAIWMPAGTLHAGRCVGDVAQRNLSVVPDVDAPLPGSPAVVEVGPLLRELMHAAETIAAPYEDDSRDARIMRLILDELRVLPVLPLHLPRPADERVARICTHMEVCPDDNSTLDDWSATLHIHVKTIQRLFSRELGMTFGEWRQRARLLFALERLAAGSTVIDVALALGYESPSAFAAMFRRQFGMSPSQYFHTPA